MMIIHWYVYMHCSCYKLPLVMPRFTCPPIYKASGTYWWWCQTSTLFAVIYKVMINGALSLLRTCRNCLCNRASRYLDPNTCSSPSYHQHAKSLIHSTGMSHQHQLSGLTAETKMAGQAWGTQAPERATQAFQTGVPRSAAAHWGRTAWQMGQAWIGMPAGLGRLIPKGPYH